MKQHHKLLLAIFGFQLKRPNLRGSWEQAGAFFHPDSADPVLVQEENHLSLLGRMEAQKAKRGNAGCGGKPDVKWRRSPGLGTC